MKSKRQLAAIMFTDIVGYTGLMGKDSSKALELVRINREIQKPLVEKHGGKWLKEMGDGAMAQFNTALDAVNCAVEIQRTSRADFDADLRIGIHLGDITIENNDVYGDGVNIAARLESIADPGGIYISESIEKAIRGQSDVQAKYLGEVKLKNVGYGVRTYAVQGGGLPVPEIKEDQQLKGPFSQIKPIHMGVGMLVLVIAFLMYLNLSPEERSGEVIEYSIAVLPFDNFSQEKEENQYLCDGFMEEVLNQLSKIKKLQVRSRSSVEQYRENRPTLPEIGQKLGVSHILEGSIQKIGNELKVVVQLILAKEDRHIWQDSYEEEMEDIFHMQSSIAQTVAGELEIQLTPQEKDQIEKAPTENLKAYDFYLRAEHYNDNWGLTRNEREFENAILFYRKAEGEDPKFAQSMVGRASMYWQAANFSESFRQEIVIDSILILCNQAITVDPKLALAYLWRGRYYDRILNETDKARSDYEKAWEFAPSDFGFDLGRFYFENKKYIRGLQLMHEGERINFGESSQIWSNHMLGYKYLEIGNTEQAWHHWDRTLYLQPGFEAGSRSQIDLALCLGEWDKAYELIHTYNALYPTNRYSPELLGMYYLHTRN